MTVTLVSCYVCLKAESPVRISGTRFVSSIDTSRKDAWPLLTCCGSESELQDTNLMSERELVNRFMCTLRMPV